MRLINIHSRELEEFFGRIPPYAILSHTWGKDDEEISFQDLQQNQTSQRALGQRKLDGLIRQATLDGFGYVWMDTCCIDKANSTELSEAINSMFKWYRQASICYAFLTDVHATEMDIDEDKLSQSRWFTRGWTLQELLAPKVMEFYNDDWQSLGNRNSRKLARLISQVTGIPWDVLAGFKEVHKASVAQRMSWAARRRTKRIEDVAYSLLGIFGVNIPMIYGEGGQAFIRLQEEIIRKIKDDSILAWRPSKRRRISPSTATSNRFGSVLAQSPKDFACCGTIATSGLPRSVIEGFGGSGGFLHVRLPLVAHRFGVSIGLLSCRDERYPGEAVGIPLLCVPSETGSSECVRPADSPMCLVPQSTPLTPPAFMRIHQNLRPDDSSSNLRRLGFVFEQQPEVPLEMIEIFPPHHFNLRNAIQTIDVHLGNDTLTGVLIRFRQKGAHRRKDFIVAVEIAVVDMRVQASCYVATASRDTTLELIARAEEWTKHNPLIPKLLCQQGASNGSLHLAVKLAEEPPKSLLYTLSLSSRAYPLARSIDADIEMKLHQCIVLLPDMFRRDQQINLQMTRLVDCLNEEELNSILNGPPIMPAQQTAIRTATKSLSQCPRNVTDSTQTEREKIQHIICCLSAQSRRVQFQIIQQLEMIQNTAAPSGKQRTAVWLEAALRVANAALNVYTNKDRPDPRSESVSVFIYKSFMRAAFRGHVAVMRCILDFARNSIAVKNSGDWAALEAAIAGGNPIGIAWLLKNRGRASERNRLGICGQFPLGLAILKGCNTSLRLLLRHGACPEMRSEGGWTSLAIASAEGNLTAAQILLEHGARVDPLDKRFQTPLSLAAGNGHQDVVQLLIHYKANVEARDKAQCSPLTHAAHRGHTQVARMLLDHGAEIDSRASSQRTPLLHAIINGHEETAEFLVQRGANIEAYDQHGITALMYAADGALVRTVALLVNDGAYIKRTNANGQNALAFANRKLVDNGRQGFYMDGGRTVAGNGGDKEPALLSIQNGKDGEVKLMLGKGAAVIPGKDAKQSSLSHRGSALRKSDTIRDEFWRRKRIVQILTG